MSQKYPQFECHVITRLRVRNSHFIECTYSLVIRLPFRFPLGYVLEEKRFVHIYDAYFHSCILMYVNGCICRYRRHDIFIFFYIWRTYII